MVKFTIYRPDSGEIVKAGDCLEQDLALQAGEGEAIWPGETLDDTLWRIVDGTKVPVTVDLAALERELLARIDRDADTIHGRLLPRSASLAETHRAKEAEARAFIDDPDLPDIETPHLALEATRTGESRAVVAAAILTKAMEWRQASAAIDALRLTGKAAVRAAETEAGKRAAFEAVDWTAVTSGEAG